MAGIGVKLNNIYGKNTLTTDLIGIGYSTVVTIEPMLAVIGSLIFMEYFLDFSSVDYTTRELFSCTVLYIFIFALLTASPFNSVLSRYMSDVIYEERYEDILPCYYVGLFLNIVFSAMVGIPFCIHEFLVGKVDIIYVFTGYCGFMALVLAFYSMLYLSICKDYKKISFFFLLSMIVTVMLGFLFVKGLHWSITYGMLLALTIGFWLIACLEFSVIRSYFREKVVQTLADAGIIVRVFGADWEKIHCKKPQNVRTSGGKVNSAACVQAMRDARIALNVMPWFKDGAHDRVFTAMLQGTAALTDDSRYLREECRDGENICFYSLRALQQLPDQVVSLLEDPVRMAELAERGYRMAEKRHRWKNRAGLLMQTLCNIDKYN